MRLSILQNILFETFKIVLNTTRKLLKDVSLRTKERQD
jgi:hypothetical protein